MVKNNYSSGRNDDRLQHPNGKNEAQTFAEEGEEGEKITDVMDCHSYSAVGNMNLNSMLIENIRSHDYFKGLAELKTFEEVVDQIYFDCTYVSPWRPGTHKAQRAAGMCSGLRGVSNAGIPSTAYMLLFKLYCLQITKNQIKRLITHKDSPYIRIVGFLYLRYVCAPKELWGWYEPYIKDQEKFSELGEEGGGQPITVGRFLHKMITELEFHDTMLPRLPVPVLRDMTKKLEEADPGAESGAGARWEQRDDDRQRAPDQRPAAREERPAAREDRPSGRDVGREDRRRDERGDERRGDERAPRSYSDVDMPLNERNERYSSDRREYDRRDADRRDERQPDYRRDDGRSYERRPTEYDRRGADHDWRERKDYGRGEGPSAGDRDRDDRRGGYDRYERREEGDAKRQRVDSGRPSSAAAVARSEPPKEETAAEKLARLKAKQAARQGGVGLSGGRIGGDYASTGNMLQPAKGIARYQQLMKDNRR
uniref:Pre-mRNA-splicing factor 38 n=1 Tax=Coccolithus braarudii TaxID=221442 RepID=A0A7S0L3S2_9EUKA|mmetsp:Transcript_18591/g.40067  ORF Transcript_18591/g.40067 Transcript_18591/m.40067 type:complete len:482 (+) Transcript_18591:68-1513(+)